MHNHFIGLHSLGHLAGLTNSLKYVILRGDDLITDAGAADLVRNCAKLRNLVLDGCRDVAEKTLAECLQHAKNLSENGAKNGTDQFDASLVATALDRSLLNELANTLPANLRIRLSDQRRNKEHYNEWDGKRVNDCKLRDTFYPFYWQDYN